MIEVREIAWREPASAFAAWADDPHVVWLDSAARDDQRSRYSYICADPFRIIEANGRSVTVDGQPAEGSPFDVLERELALYRGAAKAPVPFAGGAVGFLGYELGAWLERLPQRHPPDLGMPDMVAGLYDVVLAFDARSQNCWLISTGYPERNGARRRRAAARADTAMQRLNNACPVPAPRNAVIWRAEIGRADYDTKIRRLLDYIRAGDIFQANFTMRYLADRPPGLRAPDAYLSLRNASPAPFAAYLACGPRLSIASASPERFLQLDRDGRIETRPIKGTRPRHAYPLVDYVAARDLEASAKDRAENLMIVDLMRNDIGRVARLGSVGVPTLFGLESFASVHHLVSVVEGTLRPGLGPVDLLRATFPGGSVTGAPKVRAMEIIDELEVARRGPYCGTIAWIGFDGAMDSSIVIRTIMLTPDRLACHAGGGIVADSVPAEEYEELRTKALPLLRALGELEET